MRAPSPRYSRSCQSANLLLFSLRVYFPQLPELVILFDLHMFFHAGTIKVSAIALSHDSVQVSITDTGCGIPLVMQEKIFEPFFQVDLVLFPAPPNMAA